MLSTLPKSYIQFMYFCRCNLTNLHKFHVLFHVLLFQAVQSGTPDFEPMYCTAKSTTLSEGVCEM